MTALASVGVLTLVVGLVLISLGVRAVWPDTDHALEDRRVQAGVVVMCVAFLCGVSLRFLL